MASIFAGVDEVLRREVRLRADAGVAEGELARVAPCACVDELLHVLARRARGAPRAPAGRATTLVIGTKSFVRVVRSASRRCAGSRSRPSPTSRTACSRRAPRCAASAAPMLPPAPPRFSITTVWPQISESFCAEQARRHVGGAARRERHDEAHRLLRARTARHAAARDDDDGQERETVSSSSEDSTAPARRPSPRQRHRGGDRGQGLLPVAPGQELEREQPQPAREVRGEQHARSAHSPSFTSGCSVQRRNASSCASPCSACPAPRNAAAGRARAPHPRRGAR